MDTISLIRTRPPIKKDGTGYDLKIIAVIVIGDTVLTGKRVAIIGTVIDIFITCNSIVIVGVPELAYNAFTNTIILGMMSVVLLTRTPLQCGDMSDDPGTRPHAENQQFYGRLNTLRGVSLNVNLHEVMSLLSDNGASKLTLIMVISGEVVPMTSCQIFVKSTMMYRLKALSTPSKTASRPSVRTLHWCP